MSKKSQAPDGLGRAGSRLWESIAGAYELRADEVSLLEDACREKDIVARLEEALADAPLTVKGSMGQEVASPLVSEVRQHRTTLASLLKALKLPDSPAGAQRRKAEVSEKAREAARARWGTRSA